MTWLQFGIQHKKKQIFVYNMLYFVPDYAFQYINPIYLLTIKQMIDT